MQADKTWRVGTLAYDRRGLFNVFFWMLWGDFVLNIMDSGVGSNVALIQLNKYGASKTTIGLLMETVVEFLSIFMVVIISTWSDRHRGRLGRRMPFLLWSAPFIAIALILMGLSPQISPWMQRHAPGLLGGLSGGAATVAIFALFYLGYRFGDLFPQSVYYYLFTDVIPHDVMGKFASLFRVVAAALGSYLFIRGATSFGVWIILPFAMVAVYQGATAALTPRLLPRQQYGQFCEASAMVWHLGLMVLTPTLGFILDQFGDAMMFVWFFGFTAVGIVAMYLVYRDWKRLGGDENYRPPLVYDADQQDSPSVVAGETV